VTHIVGIGGITRNERCYGPKGEEKRKDKEKIVEGEQKNEIKEEEEKFLKIMKQKRHP